MSTHQMTTKEKILKTAKELFAVEGYATVSVRRIATKAGLSPAALYRHFKNKNELLTVIRFEGFEILYGGFKALQASLPKDELLHEACLQYINFAQEHPDFYSLMFIIDVPEDAPNGADYPPMKAFGAFQEVVKETNEAGYLDCEDYKGAAIAIWAALHGFATIIVRKRILPFGEGADVQKEVERILHFVLRK